MSERYDFDRELEAVERFIAAVQAGEVGTSEAMAAYRDRHRPAIDRLRAELASFRALLEEAETPGPEATGGGEPPGSPEPPEPPKPPGSPEPPEPPGSPGSPGSPEPPEPPGSPEPPEPPEPPELWQSGPDDPENG